MPWMAMTRDRARAAVMPRERSEMTARPSTMPAAPPSPWKKRATRRRPAPGASAAPAPATKARTEPHSRRGRRPKRSDRTPMLSCPSATPTRNMVRVSCVVEAETPRSADIRLKAGR